MVNKRIKMCKVLEMLPPYLGTNKYFEHEFGNLIAECNQFVQGTVPVGIYVFTPVCTTGNKDFPFEMHINTKGTIKAVTRKIITSEISGPTAIYESITTSKNQENGFYIVKKEKALVQREKDGPITTRNQELETITFDEEDNPIKKVSRIYQPETELTFNKELYNEWSKNVPPEKDNVTYYLNGENAIEEEKNYILGTNKKFYLQLKDGKEEKRTEISKEIFDMQMCVYNELTANNRNQQHETRLVKLPHQNLKS